MSGETASFSLGATCEKRHREFILGGNARVAKSPLFSLGATREWRNREVFLLGQRASGETASF